MNIGVTGHQNIPTDALAFIREGIERTLRRHAGNVTGVSSLAAGADQLFAEIVLRTCGRLRVVIPCAEYETAFATPESLTRFRELLAEAAAVETLHHSRPSEEAFLDAGRRVVDLSDILVAVWDGDEAKGKGGTADIVRYAHEQNTAVVVVWPEGVQR